MRNDAAPPSVSTPSQLPALYASVVTHTRRVPIKNGFRYKASYWLVDYDELPEATGLVWRLVRFERSDHSDVRALLTDHGVTADRILMLAMPRTLGYVFNPDQHFLVLRRGWGDVLPSWLKCTTPTANVTPILYDLTRPGAPKWLRSSMCSRFIRSMATTTFG